MQALKSKRKKSSLRQQFISLIDQLRKKSTFQDKIISRQAIEHLFKPIQDIHLDSTDILPITQSKQSVQTKRLTTKINENNSSFMNHNHQLPFKNCEDMSIAQVDESSLEVQSTKIKINRVGGLLVPDQGLICPVNEGRIGVIRHQLSSVNLYLHQKIQQELEQTTPRYTKQPIKTNFQAKLVPSQTLKLKVSIKQLDDVLVIRFWNGNNKLFQTSSSKQIYCYFEQLMQQLCIEVRDPLINKYKNCVYFGEKTGDNFIYQGIIYYFDEKIYYGQFLGGLKHGHGVEINFKEDTKYAGMFNAGKKNGYFCVQKQKENYQGILLHGLYHGSGKLMTEDSIYTGTFENGNKHGYGQLIYPKTGMKLKGYFRDGEYQNLNRQRLMQQASQQHLTNKLQQVITKSNSYDVSFHLPSKLIRSEKIKNNGLMHSASQIVDHSHVQEVQEFPFQEDSKSLFDMISNRQKTNKYDLCVDRIASRLPKIRLQGLRSRQFAPDRQDEMIIINKKNENIRQAKPVNRQSEQSRLASRKYYSQGKPTPVNNNTPELPQHDQPLTKHQGLGKLNPLLI